MSRAKIMLFSHICGSSFITGAEKYLLMLTSELSRHFDCVLVVPNEGLLLQEAKQRGLRSVVQPIPLVWSLFKPEGNVAQDLEESLRRNVHSGAINLLHIEQPDLVIVNTVVHPLPAAAAKTIGIPVAWFITETMAEQSGIVPAVRWIERYADWIIGISDSTLQPFRKEGLDGKLALLPPTWQQEELHPEQWPYYREQKRSELSIKPEQRLIGYISSSLHPEKGLDHFVHMALKVCAEVPDTMFLIVGNTTNPEYTEQCESKIQASGFAGRFRRLTFEPNIERLYPAMDMVVIPSLIEEGFGMTALEGLVFGKQVVAYRAGGLEEILRTTGNAEGIAVKGDADALTLKVLEKLARKPTEQQMYSSSQEAVEAFGFTTYSKRLGRLIVQFQQKCSIRRAELHASPIPPLLMNAVYKGEVASVVFLLENGVKRPFTSPDEFEFFKFRWSDIHPVTDVLLHRFPTSAPICRMAPFHRHRPSLMLAKGSGPTVYLLVNQQRFPFTSVASIQQRGYDFNQTVTIPDEELGKLELGAPLAELVPSGGQKRLRHKKKQSGSRSIKKPAARKRQGIRKKRLTRKGKSKKRAIARRGRRSAA